MIKNILIGNSQDELNGTGVTVIIAKEGAVCGADVRGSASGTREIELTKCGNLVEKINAVVLSGGSAFGLESTCGVMEFLKEQGIGYNSGGHIVPIVCGAVLFDLDYKNNSFPDKQMGYEACRNAENKLCKNGSIGAGTGATVGKLLGQDNATKSGLGVYGIEVDGVEIFAVIAVNALGDVYDEKTNQIIAGTKDQNGNFIDSEKMILTNGLTSEIRLTNTTIGCIVTNAKINREQANKLASICHNGLARSIKPVHTMFDGDTLFVLSTAEKEFDFNRLCVCGVEVAKNAILNSCKTN